MTWRAAAAEAERHIRATYKVHGIVVSGSIVRGEGDSTSDLDIFIVHAEPWRLRDQRRFLGIPTELFVNPPIRIRSYFTSEHEAGRPSTAHMLATGEVLPGSDDVTFELVKEAHAWLARPLDISPAFLASKRYGAVDLLDNARDVVDRDPPTARLLLAQAVVEIAEYVFWSRKQFLPRRKELVSALAKLDPIAAARVRTFTASTGRDAFRQVISLANHVLGVDTFFEWTSDRS